MRATKPAYLYHYTSADGLKEIILRRKIWASSVFSLNDWEEFSCGRTAFMDRLRELARKNWSLNASDIKWIEGQVEAFGPSMRPHTYVCSFSTDDDDLSQWRAYCPKGGFALGFPTTVLESLARRQEFALAACRYAENVKRQLAETLVDRISVRFSDLRSLISEESTRLLVGNTLREIFIGSIPEFKDVAFEKENEWRLISLPEAADGRPAFRTRNGLVVPYLEFELHDAELWKNVEVRVGPCPHPEEGKEFAKMLLTSGLCHSEKMNDSSTTWAGQVRNSAVPYRYW